MSFLLLLSDAEELLLQALHPIAVRKMDFAEDKVFLVVEDEDFPIAIGKKGMNVRCSVL